MKRAWALILLAVVLVWSPACRQPKKVLTELDKQQVKDSVLGQAPSGPGIVELNAGFEDKVTLLSYSVNKQRVKPGDAIALTLYWQSVAPVSGDFKIFVHLDSARARKTYDHYAVNGLYPTANWVPGEIIKDELMIQIDANFPPGPAKLWLGFFDATAWKTAKENKRLSVTTPGNGRADKSGRLLATSFMVGDIEDKNLKARKTTGKITVDGNLDEAAWKQALLDGGRFYAPEGKELPAGVQVQAGMLFDDTNLYIAYNVGDSDLQTPYKTRDATLWSGGKKGASDVVELFLDPDGDGKNYLELQVSPADVVFDAVFSSYRSPAWKKASEFNMDFRHKVVVDGTLNDSKPDKGYTVEIAIPWNQLPGMDKAPAPSKPFKLNFFRLSNSGPWAAAWSPVGNDFHDFSLAGTVSFGQ